jgi:hypothetical protein
MIVVGLTTIPERLEKGIIKKCLKSILNQTIPVDYIVVNIPEISCKGIKYSYDKAKELSKLDEKIIIRWGINDEGPITKLFGTLDFIKSKGIIDGKLVLVDDDVEYNKQIIKYLISQNNPAVGFAGRQSYIENNKVIDLQFHDEHHLFEIENISFLETFASVCYDINLFDINKMRLWVKELPSDTFYVDDIVIGAWLWKNDVVLCLISVDKNIKLYSHNAENTPELSNDNLINRNIKVFSELYFLGYFNNKTYINKYYWLNQIIYFISKNYKVIFIIIFIIILLIQYQKNLINF